MLHCHKHPTIAVFNISKVRYFLLRGSRQSCLFLVLHLSSSGIQAILSQAMVYLNQLISGCRVPTDLEPKSDLEARISHISLYSVA